MIPLLIRLLYIPIFLYGYASPTLVRVVDADKREIWINPDGNPVDVSFYPAVGDKGLDILTWGDLKDYTVFRSRLYGANLSTIDMMKDAFYNFFIREREIRCLDGGYEYCNHHTDSCYYYLWSPYVNVFRTTFETCAPFYEGLGRVQYRDFVDDIENIELPVTAEIVRSNYITPFGKFLLKDPVKMGDNFFGRHAVVALSYEQTHQRVCPDIELSYEVDGIETWFPMTDFYVCDKLDFSAFAWASHEEMISDELLAPELLPWSYACGYFLAQDDLGLYYFVDREGGQAIDGKFKDATPFAQCLSIVQSMDDKYYLIDNHGNKWLGPYKDLKKSYFSDYYYVTDGDGTTGYVDLSHQWLCRGCIGSDVAFNLAWVKKSDMPKDDPRSSGYRLMNEKGEFITDFAIDDYYGYAYRNNNYFIWRIGQGLIMLPLFDHPSGYRAIWINARTRRIIWPPGWDDPCADTDGAVIWPHGACKP